MPMLAYFMEPLTQEKDKLVQMGTIKSTKDQYLAAGFSNQAKAKNKSKDSKQQEKKKQEKPKTLDGVSNPRKDKDKKKQEKEKCTYCNKGWHPESTCMNKTIDIMAQLI